MTMQQASLARLALPASALCLCALTDPDHPAGIILCPFRLLTGWPCPMCGMTRGVAALLRARFADAIAFHLFSPLVLSAIVLGVTG